MKAKLQSVASAEATANARPFLKWVGGKTQLLSVLERRMPTRYGRYFEPFIGGGALFFYLRPSQAVLSDVNEALILTYRVIRDRVEDLIHDLAKHRYEQEYYYEIRAVDRSPSFQDWSEVSKASRLIYLNKCCFNGLYRVNSRGEFNVPFGRYKSPNFLDKQNLRACGRSLQDVELRVSHFSAIESQVRSGDFVYFDPPYAPVSATSNFTSYSKAGFDLMEQIALRDLCQRLDAKGVHFMVSNSSAPLILDIYQAFNVESVMASRTVNSLSSKRGKVPEVIITNYWIEE
ncbi:MAG: DNA adenine methylase [Cyanobacteria bacterium P01_F01_bin.42]